MVVRPRLEHYTINEIAIFAEKVTLNWTRLLLTLQIKVLNKSILLQEHLKCPYAFSKNAS